MLFCLKILAGIIAFMLSVAAYTFWKSAGDVLFKDEKRDWVFTVEHAIAVVFACMSIFIWFLTIAV